MKNIKASLRSRVDAAQGKIPCDVVIQNVTYLDVFSNEWRQGDVSIIEDTIVGLETGLKGKQTIDGKGKWLVPGFIDAHVHVESSLMTPRNFQNAVIARGTTTAICDPHELTNVIGPLALGYFLEQAEKLDLDLRVMLSSCVPATHLETNGGGIVDVQKLMQYAHHPKVLGLAEMMNVPGVLNGDPLVHAKIDAFSERVIDGHCPLLSGKALAAYAAAGISSCHESSRLDEAREKLKNGIAIWIREGSVAKDLRELSPLLTLATSTSIGFCTDDRNPLEIATEGHLDYLIRKGIQYGISPEVAYRSASFSTARHYGLKSVGAIAPGYRADLVLLNDFLSCDVSNVLKSGRFVAELDTASIPTQTGVGTIFAAIPAESDLVGPSGRVHVIGVEAGKIITTRHVLAHDDPGVARLTVLERHGHHRKPANAYAVGFGENLNGAIASSVGHDSHNLIVVGKRTSEMRLALAALIQSGGGFCVVKGETVLAHLPLPMGGLMSDRSPAEIESSLRELRAASRAIGCELPEPFLQLAFLSLPVIPTLKLTDQGLVDVDQFSIIDVRA